MRKGYTYNPYDYLVRNWDSPKDKASLEKSGRVARLSAKYTTMVKERKFGNRCTICGMADPNVLDLHHIVEVCDGGKNHLDNLICVCANCHRQIHAKMRNIRMVA